ncbi:MAG: DivIVA domain-containing protein [Clostridiales bacterium]|jgi:flagellar hook-associated protein FlgK|nr:DivIVA domain-containing protein [Clostridiales bacterium]
MPDRFSYVKKGYDPEEVDRYIETLEQVVKSYKDKDSAIKNAIISAQMAADNIVKNAHIQVAESRSQALSQIQNIITSIAEQRSKLKEFQDDYNNIIQKYLIEFNESDMNHIFNQITDLEQIIGRAAYIAPSASSTSAYAASPAGQSTYPPGQAPYTDRPFTVATSGSVAYEPEYEADEDNF